MTRPLFLLRFILALLLLCSQQMGLSHSVGHLADAGAQASAASQQFNQPSKKIASDKACQQCLAFAQADAAVASPAFTFLVPPLEEGKQLRSLARSALLVTRLHFRSRAPPFIL